MLEYTSLTQWLKETPLDAILNQILTQVKSQPQDLKARDLLFKLYCIESAWEKALIQLETITLMDDELKKQAELYKNLIFSEIQRQQVLVGARQAATFKGDMPDWMLKLHQANMQHYAGESAAAEALREEAFAPVTEQRGHSETLGAFNWIADSDSRLGPVCEFICAGGYRWLPYADIQQLSVHQPENVLDLLWLPAEITTHGERYYGYIPARYPVKGEVSQQIKLGLQSEFEQLSTMLVAGSGRKVLITDLSEQAITEVGNIVFE